MVKKLQVYEYVPIILCLVALIIALVMLIRYFV